MNVVICFSGARYHHTTGLIVSEAPKFGADKVIVYDDYWIKNHRKEWYDKHKWWFEKKCYKAGHNRGFGWFIWKPFIMADALRNLSDGDMVLYLDADTYPIQDFRMLFDIARKDGGKMFFAAEGCPQREWTKRDAYIRLGMDTPEYVDSGVFQTVGRFMVLQKGAPGIDQLLEDWQSAVLDPIINTFDPSTLAPEFPWHREPRCEQAALSLLMMKRGWGNYREACEFGNWSDRHKDLYPQLFVQKDVHGMAPGVTDPETGSAYRNVITYPTQT